MLTGKKFFITGGAGFIGTNLIGRLLDGNRVTVYDNLARNSLKDSGLEGRPGLEVIRGDLLDFDSLLAALPKDTTHLVHLAAVAGIDTVIKNPVRTIEVNTIGTYNLLRAVQAAGLTEGLERLLDFSTSEVFGINAFRVEEKTPPRMQPVGEARWTYSVSKLAAEHLTHAFYKQHGLRSVILRPFNIYGPGQVGEGAIHHFVLRALRHEPLTVHGEGEQIRSWCYIDDLLDGLQFCLEKEAAVGEAFNIGNPRGTITILGLAEKVVQLAGSRSAIVHAPRNYVDVELRIPNIDKARQVLGFAPKVDLNEGILRTLDWYRRSLSL